VSDFITVRDRILKVFYNLLKTFSKILIKYKFKIFEIVFYEFLYIFIFNYKCNSFDIKNNKDYTDNIPTPYLFLVKIFTFLNNKKIKVFVDIGCGSGRTINFFLTKNTNIKAIGYEIDNKIYLKAKKIFKNKNNIKLINKNILNEKKIINADCFFLADPFKKKKDYEKLLKKILKIRKKIYLVIVNNNKSIKILEKLHMLNEFKLNSSGFRIYSNKN
jgi:SAM-dependent methyltransferase